MLCAVRANCRTLQRPCLGAKRNALSQRFNSDPLTAAICAGIDSARQRQAARRPAASRPRTLRHWQSTAPNSVQQPVHPLCVPPPNRRFAPVGATSQMTCRRSRQPANAAGKYRSRQVGRVFMRLPHLYAPAALMSIYVSAASESRWFCRLGRQNCHIRTCRQSRHTGAILALST